MYKFTFIPLFFFFFSFFCFSPVYSQTISNIRTVQSGNNIIIYYSLSGAKFNQVLNVSVYLSKDGGQTFQGPLSAVSGDVGKNATMGNKKITWDVFREVTDMDGNIVFDVRAEVIEEEIKKSWFVSYSGNLIAPIGLSFGRVGKTSWYISAKLSPSFRTETVYDCDNEKVIKYDKEGYYTFDDEVIVSCYLLSAGLIFQSGRNFFIYTGAGYGSKDLIWHINEYTYPNDQPAGDSYVKNTGYSYSGFEAEAGMIFRFGKVLVSCGATNLNFTRTDFAFGLGYSF
ncbi:MAG: hypothetical protein HQ543_11295 [Bacteroidetes bacterium]|nr:hypothetical protein [Bacteroidota bacterium]